MPSELGITPNPELMNFPSLVSPEDLDKVPAPGAPLEGDDFDKFVDRVSEEIAKKLDLNKV